MLFLLYFNRFSRGQRRGNRTSRFYRCFNELPTSIGWLTPKSLNLQNKTKQNPTIFFFFFFWLAFFAKWHGNFYRFNRVLNFKWPKLICWIEKSLNMVVWSAEWRAAPNTFQAIQNFSSTIPSSKPTMMGLSERSP